MEHWSAVPVSLTFDENSIMDQDVGYWQLHS